MNQLTQHRRRVPYRCVAGPSLFHGSGFGFAASADELAEQPARPNDLCGGGSKPFGQFTVGRHHDHVTIGPRDGGDRVVALVGRMHDLPAAHIRLIGSGPGSALEHDRRLTREPD